MRSPGRSALMFDFDKSGKPVPGSGKEMPMQGWMLEYGEVLPDDCIVLVEAITADGGRLLMKCLDSGLLRDGARKVTVMELVSAGKLWEFAARFRDEYMRRMFA